MNYKNQGQGGNVAEYTNITVSICANKKIDCYGRLIAAPTAPTQGMHLSERATTRGRPYGVAKQTAK